MSFLSFPFFIGFSLFTIVYYRVPSRWQNGLLLAANLSFLLLWGARATIAFLVMAGLTFFSTRAVVGTPRKSKSRFALISFQLVLLASIFVGYKIDSLWLSRGAELRDGLFVSYLPIGLSYYTFLCIAYALEAHWGRIRELPKLLDFALFSSFFPALPMGPIERYGELGPQLESPRTWSSDNVIEGIVLICLGTFKKLAIANVLLRSVDGRNAALGSVYGFGLILYCFLSFAYVYADFSGFIDIATGIARILGIRLAKNFNRPYLSSSVGEMWHRWHISLVTWLRDFLYWPILLKTRNVFLASAVIIFLAGVWHSFLFNYLLWAAYWILLFEAYVLYRNLDGKFRLHVSKPIACAVTLTLVNLSSLAFLVSSLDQIPGLIFRLFRLTPSSLRSFFTPSLLSVPAFTGIGICFAALVGAEALLERPRTLRVRLALVLSLLFLTAAFASSDSSDFIYLRY